jgi:glycine/D-amino acid oxidase-like deaminating enzyme
MVIDEKSVWRNEKKSEAFESLSGTIHSEIAIIGGGITGMAAAYMLRGRGADVVLLEGSEIGAWGSSATTAFLMEHIDTDIVDLVDRVGSQSALSIIASHGEAIQWYEDTVSSEKIECEFIRCPAYLFARNAKEAMDLKKEAEAAKRVGMNAVFSAYQEFKIPQMGHMRIGGQAKFHPLKFLYALTSGVANSGVRIYENTKVGEIHENNGEITIHCENGEVHAKRVLMATHYPLDPQPAKLRFKKAWYTTYVIQAEIEKNILPEALFADCSIPYHYIRIDKGKDKDLLMLGGEDHRSDIPVDPEKSYSALEEYLKEILPSTSHALVRRWKGGIVESGDGLAYIGPIDGGRVFYATGYSGNGMTYGVIAAKMFKDFCVGKQLQYAEYAADRPFSARTYIPKAVEYVQELFGGAVKNSLKMY